MASFFTDLATSVEINAFTPHSFAAGEDAVHLLVDWTIRSPSTGREASMTMHHYWRLRDGKVTYFRGSEDTELTAQCLRRLTGQPARSGADSHSRVRSGHQPRAPGDAVRASGGSSGIAKRPGRRWWSSQVSG